MLMIRSSQTQEHNTCYAGRQVGRDLNESNVKQHNSINNPVGNKILIFILLK